MTDACFSSGTPGDVLSFSETRAQSLVNHRAEQFLAFNQRQLSRIYPSAYRIDSSNFNPQFYWNVGCQLGKTAVCRSCLQVVCSCKQWPSLQLHTCRCTLTTHSHTTTHTRICDLHSTYFIYINVYKVFAGGHVWLIKRQR